MEISNFERELQLDWNRRPVFVVEVAYVDPRPTLHDRESHLDAAAFLLGSLQRREAQLVKTVFVNDLASESKCGIECSTDETNSRQTFASTKLVEIRGERYRAIGMRGTRNRATKAFKRALQRGLHHGIGIEIQEEAGELGGSVFARCEDGDVFLGLYDGTTRRIIPRCTLIMAQHYYDLFRLAVREVGNVAELVIIDFSHGIERDRVARGAMASFVLHEWPSGIHVRIANIIIEGDMPTRVEVHSPHLG